MTEEYAERLASSGRLRRYSGIAEMIGDPANPTPLVALNRVVPDGGAQLYVKLEWMNPFGSVKDRAAKWMLESMEARGELEGKGVVEATSGNTGIALAAMSALLGHPMVAAVPSTMPAEKSVLIKSLGAAVVPTPESCPTDRHPMDVAIEIAEKIVTDSPAEFVMPNQYDNPDNVRAHYETTGPEVWAQTEGRIDYFIVGIGTCGTVTGAGRFLKEQNPNVRIVAVEPVRGHHISGLKNLDETSIPGILDRSVIDATVYVDDEETRQVAKRLHAEEALFVGSSGAAVIAGALRYLEGRTGVAVAIAPDSSQKAISFLTAMLDGE
ncbi:MAG TPA: cysteine synthase family protein [Coriobacteriia bacterium]|nr:cysteine synthase family protein [Coriobacteriia bacterium]